MGFSYESSEGLCERVVIGSQARLRIWCLVRMGSSPFARTQSSGDKAFRLRYHCFCIMIFWSRHSAADIDIKKDTEFPMSILVAGEGLEPPASGL